MWRVLSIEASMNQADTRAYFDEVGIKMLYMDESGDAPESVAEPTIVIEFTKLKPTDYCHVTPMHQAAVDQLH